MYLGNHVGALQQAGIPLRRVINEGNHRTWKQPVDLDGLWERALVESGRSTLTSSLPAKAMPFPLAVLKDVQKQDLIPLAVIHTSGQPMATIYRTRSSR